MYVYIRNTHIHIHTETEKEVKISTCAVAHLEPLETFRCGKNMMPVNFSRLHFFLKTIFWEKGKSLIAPCLQANRCKDTFSP